MSTHSPASCYAAGKNFVNSDADARGAFELIKTLSINYDFTNLNREVEVEVEGDTAEKECNFIVVYQYHK